MSKLKAVFFDLDDTLYTSFQAGDRYAYECMEKWAQETFGEAGHGFDAAFLTARKQLAAEQPDMPPIHDRVLFAQRALENMGLNAVPHARKAAAVYWDAVFAKMTVRPGAPEFMDELHAHGIRIAVVTNMLADIQMEKLMRLGLSERIDYLGARRPALTSRTARSLISPCANAACSRTKRSWWATTSHTMSAARMRPVFPVSGSTGRTRNAPRAR